MRTIIVVLAGLKKLTDVTDPQHPLVKYRCPRR